MTTVVVTGATGFVGSELTRSLLAKPWVERVVVLARPLGAEPGSSRMMRLKDLWGRYLPPVAPRDWAKLEVQDGDLAAVTPRLPVETSLIFHSAAATDLSQTLGAARRDNLLTTQHLASAARRCQKLQRFVHFSTAYVSGKDQGLIDEMRPLAARYHNAYERSKADAECAVRLSHLPYTILRPSIIVGRSDNGYVYRMKVLYAVWRLWLTGVVPRAPLDANSWIDLVPIDYVVDAAIELAQSVRAAEAQTIHLVAGEDRQSPASVMRLAAEIFRVPVPPLSPPWTVPVLRLPFVSPFLAHSLREAVDKMHWQVPYIGMRGRLFSDQRAKALLTTTVRPAFADYGRQLFRFCVDSAWGKRPLVATAAGALSGEGACSRSAS